MKNLIQVLKNGGQFKISPKKHHVITLQPDISGDYTCIYIGTLKDMPTKSDYSKKGQELWVKTKKGKTYLCSREVVKTRNKRIERDIPLQSDAYVDGILQSIRSLEIKLGNPIAKVEYCEDDGTVIARFGGEVYKLGKLPNGLNFMEVLKK